MTHGDDEGRGVTTAAARAVIVFARAPAAGQVKTRLAAVLGDTAALEIYRDLGARALGAARGVADCAITVAFTPAGSARALRDWLGDVTLEAQPDGDLGERLHAAITARFTAGARKVVVIGTDCPALDARGITAAFDSLGEADVVFGPASDGGYYLVGLTRPCAGLFQDVPWSAADTLARSLARAAALGLRAALLPPLDDVDTAADLRRWRESSGA